ncbi:MAG: DUF998 domain-containing protein [Candidatus Helarchaeota archaeon]
MNVYPFPYSFWGNYFSDLGRTYIDFGRIPNPISSTLFFSGLIIAGIAFIPFWVILKTIYLDLELKHLSTLGTSTGIISSIFLIAVAIFPTNIYYTLHAIVASIFFVSFALGIFIFTVIIFRNSKYPNFFAYIGIFVLAIILLYVFTPVSRPLFQKLCIYSIMLWVLTQNIKIWDINSLNI